MNIALLGFGVVGSGVYEWCRGREAACTPPMSTSPPP